MLKKLILSLITISFLFNVPVFAQPKVINFSDHTPVNAGLRSLILPGWGQFFNHQKTKGFIVSGSAVVTVLGSYLLYTGASNTYNDYEKKGLKDDTLYSDYETQQQQAMIVSLIAAGVWIYGVVDAFVIAKKPVKTEGLFIIPTLKGMKLAYSKRF
jgi:hypothetical protein